MTIRLKCYGNSRPVPVIKYSLSDREPDKRIRLYEDRYSYDKEVEHNTLVILTDGEMEVFARVVWDGGPWYAECFWETLKSSKHGDWDEDDY